MQDHGLSPAALALAVAALLAAALSVWLAAGTVGARDQRGAAGTRQGAPARSATKAYERVEGPVRTLAPTGDPSGNDTGASIALCPPGLRVLSGGYQTIPGDGGVFYSGALMSGRVGWAVGAVNNLAQSATLQAFAYCAGTGGPVGATRSRLARQRAASKREIQGLIDRYRALRVAQRSGAL